MPPLARSAARTLAGAAPALTVRAALAAGRVTRRRATAESLAVSLVSAAAPRAGTEARRRALDPLVQQAPRRPGVAADLAALLVALGDPGAAVRVCLDGLARTTGASGRARLQAQLGRAHLRDDAPDLAVPALRAALDDGDIASRPVWRVWLAQALVAVDDLAGAREVLDAEALAALDPAQQARAVRILVDAGSWGEVARAAEAGAIDDEALARAARLAARAGRDDVALTLARAAGDATARAAALVDVARNQLAREDEVAALASAREAVDEAPRSLEALTVLTRVLQRTGRLADARALVQVTADGAPDDADVLRWAVDAAYRLRSWEEAAALAARLLPLDELSSRTATARIAVRAHAHDAEEQVAELRRDRPDDPEIARVEGELHQRSSRAVDAYEAFTRAVVGLPDDAEIRLACARLAIQLHRDEEALEHLDVLLEQRPRDERLRRLQVRAEARLQRRVALDDLVEHGADPIDEHLVFELVGGLLEGRAETDAAAALERALHDRAARATAVDA